MQAVSKLVVVEEGKWCVQDNGEPDKEDRERTTGGHRVKPRGRKAGG